MVGTPRPPRWVLWVILGLSLLVRGRALQQLGNNLHADPDSYRQIADCLAEHHTFGLLHYANDPVATAFRPPLYPWLLSWGAPYYHEQALVIGGFHLLLGLLTIWMTWRVGLAWTENWILAALAALLVAFDPLLIQQSSVVMTETLATALVILALWVLPRDLFEPSGPYALVGMGIVLGYGVLCRPTFAVWTGMVLVGLYMLSAITLRVQTVLLCGLGVVIATAPWLMRNQKEYGQLILTTTHGGQTLYRANNPRYYQHLRTTSWGTPWNSDEFDIEWRSIAWREKSEPARDRLAYRLAWQSMRDEPGMFFRSCAVRLSRLWGLVPWQTDPAESPRTRWLRYAIGGFYLFEFALALFGMWTNWDDIRNLPWLWVLTLFGAFTLVHTFYWTDMRMRAPLMPAIALTAALGATETHRRIFKRKLMS